MKSERQLHYLLWYQMISRCTKPTTENYQRYGGRGITVCERWLDFGNFLADMGSRPSRQHSIERIDNNGPYAPGNCRWATRLEQGQNKRNNRLLTFNGHTMTLNALARLLGIPRTRLATRLMRGWTVEQAATHSPWERRPEHAAGHFRQT